MITSIPVLTHYLPLFHSNQLVFPESLELNPSKSECMFVDSPALLSKSNLPSVITPGNTNFRIYSKSTLLGATLDSNLNFSHSVLRTIQTSNFHIQTSEQVHQCLPLPTTVTLSLISHLKIGIFQLPYLWSSSKRPF